MSQLVSNCVLATAAIAALLAGGPAQGQDDTATGTRIRTGVKPVMTAPEPPPADATVSGVTITAPRTIERSRTSGITQEMTMSARVPYGDLDMKTGDGVAELNRRVDEAAKYVCRQLTMMYPNGEPDTFACVKDAVGDAQPQVRVARGP
jgi:UrcA family protein